MEGGGALWWSHTQRVPLSCARALSLALAVSLSLFRSRPPALSAPPPVPSPSPSRSLIHFFILSLPRSHFRTPSIPLSHSLSLTALEGEGPPFSFSSLDTVTGKGNATQSTNQPPNGPRFPNLTTAPTKFSPLS
jgi:hypothetical protein